MTSPAPSPAPSASGPHASDAAEFTPATQAELTRFVEENYRGARRPLFPVGGRTALRHGYAPTKPGTTVNLEQLQRVLDYPARDMTITVEAGITIAELQGVLRKEGQRLPIDIPLAHRATLGGAIATNTSGPSRLGSGTFRDYVIGISAVDGTGRRFSAGGRVVKNVAGYDLCKLLIGSLGTLGIISQVTLKVRPKTESHRAVWSTFAGATELETALANLLTSATRPMAVEILNPKAARHIARESKVALPLEQPVLLVAFEGTAREVDWQVETFRSELAASGPSQVETLSSTATGALWIPLTEYQAASDDPLTFQASLPPSRVVEFVESATPQGVAIQAHAGSGIVVGHLPDRCASAESASTALRPLRDLAERHGGNLVILSCDDAWSERLSLFGTPRGDRALMERVQKQFDPAGVLNPGRLFRS